MEYKNFLNASTGILLSPSKITAYHFTLGVERFQFRDLADLMARASPDRSGDHLAGIAATSDEQRVAAQMALAELPLKRFLEETVVPYEQDEVTRLIIDDHEKDAFSPISGLTVGGFRSATASRETLRP